MEAYTRLQHLGRFIVLDETYTTIEEFVSKRQAAERSAMKQERLEELRWLREAQKEGGPIGLMKSIWGLSADKEYVLDYDREEVSAVLDQVLDTFTPRERTVIERRYALIAGDTSPRTYEVIGREFNVTRERIRQIEHKALRKLRHPTRRLPLDAHLIRRAEEA